MNTENKMKQIVIIAGVVIIFLLAAPYLYKVLLYGVGYGDSWRISSVAFH